MTGKYRQGLLDRFLGSLPERQGTGPCIWIHAVSVGEVQVAATVVQNLRHRWPAVQIVVTCATQAGLRLAQSRFAADHADLVALAPLDFTWAIRRAIGRIRPDLLLLIELEIWPNWIRQMRSCGVPVAVINGRLSPRSFRGYRRIRSLIRSTFAKLDLVAAQDNTYATRFAQLGTPAERIHVTGSIKFDGAESNRNHPRILELRQRAQIQAEDRVWVVGSTQAPEEKIAIQIFRELQPLHPRLRLVLVPRHPERFTEVAGILNESGLRWDRWTQLSRPSGLASKAFANESTRILLVDAVGDLRFWWGTAEVAFVGGSLSRRGGQNMIEPAAYGAALCFGPNTVNFRDVVEQLLAARAAVVVRDEASLKEFVDKCMSHPELVEQMGTLAKEVVERHRGATEQTMLLLEHLTGDRLQGELSLATRMSEVSVGRIG